MAVDNETVLRITKAADRTMALAEQWRKKTLAADERVAALEATIRRIAVQSWRQVDDDDIYTYWSQCRLCEARIEGDTVVMMHRSDCMLAGQGGEGKSDEGK